MYNIDHGSFISVRGEYRSFSGGNSKSLPRRRFFYRTKNGADVTCLVSSLIRSAGDFSSHRKTREAIDRRGSSAIRHRNAQPLRNRQTLTVGVAEGSCLLVSPLHLRLPVDSSNHLWRFGHFRGRGEKIRWAFVNIVAIRAVCLFGENNQVSLDSGFVFRQL